MRLAETNLKNKQTLRTRKVASEMQFLDAKAQRDIAAAKVDEVRANVELGQISLQQMKLYAPITDIISRAFIREGQRGARSKPARHHCPARSHPRSQASCCCRKFPAQRQGRRSAQNAGADRRAAGIQACPAPCQGGRPKLSTEPRPLGTMTATSLSKSGLSLCDRRHKL